jgi:HlyD family secretion protein
MRFAATAILLSTLAAGLGYAYSQGSSPETFLTAPVERGSISTLVKASGTVEAVVSVDVSSQLSGRIAHVFVNFNDTVKAGEPIAQIDPEIFAARVNEAKAVLSVARATAEVEKAALERATVAVTNAQTAPRSWRRLSRRQTRPGKMKWRESSCESANWRAPEAEQSGTSVRRKLCATPGRPTCAVPSSRSG